MINIIRSAAKYHTSSPFLNYAKPQFKPKQKVNSSQNTNQKQNETVLGKVVRIWMGMPLKHRLYVCVSTFLVAYGGDWLTTQIYETSQRREAAKRATEEEISKLDK